MGCAEPRAVEFEIAEELIRSMEPEVSTESVCGDAETIRIRLSAPGWKLSSLIFSRAALERLHADPNRRIKLEYLSRDIARAGRTRREYRYPRFLVPVY